LTMGVPAPSGAKNVRSCPHLATFHTPGLKRGVLQTSGFSPWGFQSDFAVQVKAIALAPFLGGAPSGNLKMGMF